MFYQIIGCLASFMSAISLTPQIYKTYRAKSAADLSWLMLISFALASFFWVIYGYSLRAIPIWGTNLFMLATSLTLVFYKIIYKKI